MEGYGNENPGAFQPTRPLRGATVRAILSIHHRWISTHAPLAGRDDKRTREQRKADISTHAPLAGRDALVLFFSALSLISTHAPLAGRDCSVRDRCHKYFYISTHAPLAGRDDLYS